MSVVDFRPHTFSYRIVEQGQVNSKGDYVPAPHSWSAPCKCNAVPNGGTASIKNAEGRCIEYSFILYASTQVKDFLYGEVLRIERCGIVYELTVKGFQRYKGFVKIWV